jgi:ATP-dependent Clp protease ATP-binding subunit ClpC
MKRPKKAAASFKDGTRLQDVGAIPQAIAAFTNCLQENPQDTEALLRLAHCHEILEQWTYAVDAYRRVLDAAPNKVDALLAQAESLRNANCYYTAITCLDRVLGLDTDNQVAWAGKGEALRLIDRPIEALGCFDEALRVHPKNPFSLRGKAAALNAAHRYEEALVLWDEALALDSSSSFAVDGRIVAQSQLHAGASPKASTTEPPLEDDEYDDETKREWARALAREKRLHEADALYQALLKKRPDWVAVLSDYLEYLNEEAQWQLAIGVSERLLKLEPNHPQGLILGGDAHRRKGAYPEALELYRAALSHDATNIHVHTSCGEALRMLERPEEALAHYEIAINADNVFALRGKAAALNEMERFAEALEIWNNALAIDPENEFAQRGLKTCLMELNQPENGALSRTNRSRAHVHYDAALNLVEQGRYEAAIETCAKATKADPLWPDCWLLLGKLYNETHEYFSAVDAFGEVMRLRPADPDVAAMKGDALRKQNDFRQAVESYDIAIKLDEGHLLGLAGKGEALRALGEFNEAIACFDRTLAIDSTHFYSLCGKAACLNTLERYEEAHPYWLLALAENPISPFVKRGLSACETQRELDLGLEPSPLDSQSVPDSADLGENGSPPPHLVDRQSATDELDRGRSYYREQKYAEAARCFERALEIDPKLSEACLRLGMAYEDDRQFRRAIESYEQCLEIDPNHHQAATNIGEAYRKNERYDEAIQAYDYALTLKPDYLYGLAGRSECMRMLGDYEGSLVWFDKALAQGQRHAFALQGKAAALNALHRLREAKPLWKLALSIEPQSQFALDGLSFCESQLLRESMETSRTEPEAPTGPPSEKSVESSSATPTIDEQGRDLTALAKSGNLSTTIGRKNEIRALIKTLMRRTKANPILLGEPGVGKTAVVEGLAHRIAAGEVPPKLQGRRLIELSLGSLVAGTKYRGTFEERLKNIVKECVSNPNIILFVDEIHTLVGAGRTEGGSLDAANILKPALARGEITVIGATTLTEYRKSFETDSALERRFQPVDIEEPSIEETVVLLTKVRSHYTAHHEVEVEERALRACVTMAIRYIPDRRLPDKALDILDEACAEASLSEDHLVTPAVVAKVVSERTGVPIADVSTDERKRLQNLESVLSKRVVGQELAIARLANAIRLARTGLRSAQRPRGVFLMAGPIGVGKSDLAKAAADLLFPEGNALVRLDMSEYTEKFSVSRLIGAPPGYSGHGDEGLLTGPLRRRPYAVVVLDEFEKAHPDVQSLFLSLFEEGTIKDSEGREVHGKEAFFLLTTNAGNQSSAAGKMGFSKSATTDPREQALAQLRPYFQPQLLQRLDDIVVFSVLEPEHLTQIAEIHLEQLKDRAADEGVSLSWSEEVAAVCAGQPTVKNTGARGVIRAVESLVAEALGTAMINADSKKKSAFRVVVNDGEVCVEQLKTVPQAGQGKAKPKRKKKKKEEAV